MAVDLGSGAALLKGLDKVEWDEGARALPPVQRWNPPFRGDIDMRIARDGTWFHEGAPIGRFGLVRLFSGILRRDPDDAYYLVTPAEKVRIQVDDAPFVAVAMEMAGEGAARTLTFRTNVGDTVAADGEHPIRVETHPATGEPSPYVLVRDRLEALIARAVFYDLVALAEEDGEGGLFVRSGGVRFPLGQASEPGA